ncbi:MAG: hypothetical protein ACE5HV_08115 [Acidobacteriota bacterium]
MANLTIAVDAEVLQRARLRALRQGTSVNELLRQYLKSYTAAEETRVAMKELVELAKRSRASSGAGGRSWTRDELHDR